MLAGLIGSWLSLITFIDFKIITKHLLFSAMSQQIQKNFFTSYYMYSFSSFIFTVVTHQFPLIWNARSNAFPANVLVNHLPTPNPMISYEHQTIDLSVGRKTLEPANINDLKPRARNW